MAILHFSLIDRIFRLFVWSLSSHSRVFHSYGDVSIAGEGLQILTYARHSWPMSSERSLTYHTYCDTDQPFIIVISEDPWHSHLLPSVWQRSYHYLLLRLKELRPGIEPRSPTCDERIVKLQKTYWVIEDSTFFKNKK